MFTRFRNNQGRGSTLVTRVSQNRKRHATRFPPGSSVVSPPLFSFRDPLIVTRKTGSSGKVRDFESGNVRGGTLRPRQNKPVDRLVNPHISVILVVKLSFVQVVEPEIDVSWFAQSYLLFFFFAIF